LKKFGQVVVECCRTLSMKDITRTFDNNIGQYEMEVGQKILKNASKARMPSSERLDIVCHIKET
jgi:hypothetical protein